jgi:hypothetical protein
MESDQQGLIRPDTRGALAPEVALPLFLFLQISHLLWIGVGAAVSIFPNSVMIAGHILLAFVNLVSSSGALGKALVGLSWHINWGNLAVKFWDCYIEPDPFVATKLNSNCFWICVGGSVVLWLFLAVRSLFITKARGIFWPFISAILCAFYCTNFAIFLRVQQLANKQSMEAVRTVLLGHSSFPRAQEVFDSDEEEGDEKSQEPEGIPEEDPHDGEEDDVE